MLTEMGVAVRDSEGQFRDFGAVMDDLNGKWGSLTQTEKIATAQQVAGIHRYNQFMSMMNNYQMSLDATTTALNSQGSATKENEIYMQSAQAKLNTLKTTMQEFALNTINSDFMKGIIDGLTKFIEIMGNLPAVIGLATLSLMLFKGKAIEGMITSLASFVIEMAVATESTNAFTIAMVGLDGAMDANPIGVIALAITALGAGMYALVQHTKKATDYVGQLNEATKSLEDTKAVDNLIQKYEDLENAIYKASTIDEKIQKQKELVEVQKQLAETYPLLIDSYNAEGVALITNIDAVKEKLKSVKSEDLDKAKQSYKDLMGQLDPEPVIKKGQVFSYDSKSGNIGISANEKQTQIARYQELISKQSEMTEKEKKEMTEIQEKLISAKEAVLKLASAGGDVSDMKIFDFTKKSMVDATTYINENTKSLEKNTIAKSKNGEEYDSKSKYDSAQSDFKDSMTAIQTANGFIKDLQSNGLKGDILSNIIKEYPELSNHIGDLTYLQDALNKKIKSQSDIQKKAYIDMMSNDEEYYANNIQNSESWKTAMNDVLTAMSNGNVDYYNQNGKYMKSQLANAKTLSKARALVEQETVNACKDAWSKYYDAITFTTTSGTKLNSYGTLTGSDAYRKGVENGSLDYGESGLGGALQNQIAKNAKSNLDKANEAQRQSALATKKALDDIKFDVPDLVNLDTSSSKDSTTKDIQNLESLVDRYLNINQALNTVNATLSAYEIAMKNAHGQENISYIQKEIEAYKQKQTAISNNIAELKREKSELASAISSSGFNIDSMDRITNYSAQLTALTNQANAMASGTDAQEKAREKAKSDVQAISEKIKRFSDITSQEIPKMDDEWQSLTNTIQDTYKTMQKLVVDAESKITEVIKDELTRRTNAKIEALDKEKKLLDDKNKSDDYADTLQEAQTKVTDYDSKIMEAIKSRDKESIKSLTQAKQDAMDELNKTIQDHERESVSNKFDEEKQKLQDNLTDLTNPENMTKLISESMANGFINVNGEVIKLSDAMDNFLKNSVSGVQSLKSEMSDLVNIMNDGISALGNAGMLNNVKNSTLGNLAFGGNVLNNFNTTVPSVSTSNNLRSFVMNSPLVHIERVDSNNIDEVNNIVESKFNNFIRIFNDNSRM